MKRTHIMRATCTTLAALIVLAGVAGCNLTRNPGDAAPGVTDIPLVLASPTFLFDPASVQPGGQPTALPGVGITPVAGPIEGINPNCPAPPGWVAYTVEPGDSMSLLAAQASIAIDDLMVANCLADADQIFVGQVLFLPTAPIAEG